MPDKAVGTRPIDVGQDQHQYKSAQEGDYTQSAEYSSETIHLEVGLVGVGYIKRYQQIGPNSEAGPPGTACCPNGPYHSQHQEPDARGVQDDKN